MKLSTEFREFRKKHLLSMERFSYLLGVHYNTVWKTENELTTPQANTVFKFRVLQERYRKARSFL
jgi:predicted transcriptional regulator